MTHDFRGRLTSMQGLVDAAADDSTRAILEALWLQSCLVNERLAVITTQLSALAERVGNVPLAANGTIPFAGEASRPLG
ncbi:conserved hypothetical protein [Burkholderiales bacterium 8X]|nr:conserved hypothetical protein [Burkholderiales bacterium 8X]